VSVLTKIFLAMTAAVLLSNCSSVPVEQAPPSAPSRPAVSVFGNSDEGVGVGVDIGGQDEPVKPPVVHRTGRVDFRGFSQEALADFRIVPEEGLRLVEATNGVHENVDGFWWRHSREWFKIPNHCSVILTPNPQSPHVSGFQTEIDCNELGSKLQRLRGMPDRAGFYPDVGNTGHGTNYPF
jgi:hypothetical protein